MKRSGRPPALTLDQQQEVQRRLAAGAGVRQLAREYRVGVATISKHSEQSEQVRKAAESLASAQTAIAALPPAQQYQAVTLAEKLRAISDNMAAAAVSGADTAKTLHGIANSKARRAAEAIAAGKDSAATEDLRAVAALTKLGNEAASVPLGLLSGGKSGAMQDPHEDTGPRFVELVAPGDPDAARAA